MALLACDAHESALILALQRLQLARVAHHDAAPGAPMKKETKACCIY
tara:strand:- start:1803 stop:1943 length:141 start_codon:yes stop_codon:yes gene_type:complete